MANTRGRSALLPELRGLPEMATEQQVAELFQVQPGRIRAVMGDIAVTVGRQRRYPRSLVQGWVIQHRAQPAQQAEAVA